MADPFVLDYETPSPRQPPKGAMRTLFLIVLIDLFGFGVVIPTLPFYRERFHTTAAQAINLFTIFSACQFIAAPIFGLISDRFGRRGVLFASQLGGSLSYLMLGIVTQIHWHNPALGLTFVYVARALAGFAGGNISTAQAYIADITTGDQRAKGMGMLGAAFGIGFTLGPAIGGALAHNPQQLHWAAYLAALFSLAAAIATFLRLPETNVHKPATDEVWLHPSRFGIVLSRPALLQLLLISFISMFAYVMTESSVGLYLNDTLQFTPLGVGLTFGAAGIIIILVQGGLIGRITHAVGEWPPAILGPFLVSVGMIFYVAIAFGDAWHFARPVLLTVLMVGLALNAAGRSLQQPTLSSLISKFSDPREQGTVFGLFHGLGSLARTVGPYLASVIYGRHHASPFATAGLLLFAAAAWMLNLRLTTARAAPRGFEVLTKPAS